MEFTPKTPLLIVIGVIVIIGLIGYGAAQRNQAGEGFQEGPRPVRIAYLPIGPGLPFYLALEKGYFQEAGLEVEPLRLEAPNHLIDALINGNADVGAPGTATGIMAISQLQNPDTLKLFALNGGAFPDNIDNVLLVKSDSSITDIADLRGKKVGTLPGIQFRTIARHILAQAGINAEEDAAIVELALPLQLQALTSGQVDALLTLEPVGTIGRGQKVARDLVIGPITRHIADPWYGGGGVISTNFVAEHPETARKVVDVFSRSIAEISEDPSAARQYLKQYTPLTDNLIQNVPLPIWKTHLELQPADIDALQKFLDVFTDYSVVTGRINARELIFTP